MSGCERQRVLLYLRGKRVNENNDKKIKKDYLNEIVCIIDNLIGVFLRSV